MATAALRQAKGTFVLRGFPYRGGVGNSIFQNVELQLVVRQSLRLCLQACVRRLFLCFRQLSLVGGGGVGFVVRVLASKLDAVSNLPFGVWNQSLLRRKLRGVVRMCGNVGLNLYIAFASCRRSHKHFVLLFVSQQFVLQKNI